MDAPATRPGITVRIVRTGSKPAEDDWAGSSPAERLEAVWELTRLCLAWQGLAENDEPRLQRSVVRIQRNGR